jgi:nitroreductase
MSILENQNWRYSAKKYDSSKKVSEKDLELILEAARMSASSYGLQPYKVLVIENTEIRKELLPNSWNQSQIVDASHLLVLVHKTHLTDLDIDKYVKLMSETRGIAIENLAGFANFTKGKLSVLDKNWAAKQTYIVLGNILEAAAELKIDATPMEGFEADKYDEILNLSKDNWTTSLVIPIGYRHNEDKYKDLKKVRKSREEFIEIIK